jgi:membrane protein
MQLKTAWRVVRETLKAFSEDKVLRLSAAMAYYAIFSIGPLLVLIVGLAGLVFGGRSVRQEVHQQLQSVLGEKSARVIESMMAARHWGDSLMATILGAAGLLFGAAGVFGQLQDSLNTIWGVTPKPGHSLWLFIRDRFLSMAMVLGIGFLLLISMVLSTLLTAFAHRIGNAIALSPWLLPAFNDLVSFGVISLLFAAIYKVLPDVRLRWKDVWSGALLSAFLFTVGKYLLSLYLGRAAGASVYGAGSAFVVILMYIYYSSVILFFGAEFAKARVRVRGAKLELSQYAVPVTNEQRAEQGLAPAGDSPRVTRAAERHSGEAAPERAGTPSPASLHTKGIIMEQKTQTKPGTPFEFTQPHRAPLERIKARPWSFVGLALAVGIAAGVMLRFKTLRRIAGFYFAH